MQNSSPFGIQDFFLSMKQGCLQSSELIRWGREDPSIMKFINIKMPRDRPLQQYALNLGMLRYRPPQAS